MAFATIEDLENRWRALTETETTRAETLLEDASVILETLLNDHGIEIETETQENLVKAIACNMVARCMSVNDDLIGVKQYTQTAGSYSGSFTYANTGGDLYLSSQELKWLGIKKQRIGAVRGAIHDPAGDEIASW